jgi:acetyl-CoA carboxylase biotin carboxylase subunit
MCDAAVESIRAIGYRGAGTVECVLTPGREFFLLEVNARLQVEHPITEVTTHVDLVEEQLRVASGQGLSFEVAPPRNGFAMEARIYAEDPRTFLPSPGRITRLAFDQPWEWRQWRFDLGYDEPMFYDPLVGKFIAHDGDFENAPLSVIEDLQIEGIKTNISAILGVLRDERFRSGEYDTGLIGK